MSYEQDLKKFNSLRKKLFADAYTKHFKDRCSERDLELDKVKEFIKKAKIKGFINQEEDNYKVILEWDSNKDLNIFLNFHKRDGLHLKTVHVSKIETRKRIK